MLWKQSKLWLKLAMTTNNRSAIVGLVVSAALLVGLISHEGYTDKAIIPVKGDVPTKGFGTTRNLDGTPVKIGDTTTPVRALVDAYRDVNGAATGIKKCIKAPLSQNEFDAYTSLAYNVGVGAVCGSSIPLKLELGLYEQACNTIADFNGICSLRNAAGKCIKKKIIKGLVTRREAERRLCLQA